MIGISKLHCGIVQPCGFIDLPCAYLRACGFDVSRLPADAGTLQRLGSLKEIERLSGETALAGGRMMGSIREFKKTSMQYSAEDHEKN